MESVALVAEDISCDHCQHAIETAVGDMDGVETVSVDIPTKTAHITFDSSRVSRRGIETVMAEEGYPVADSAV